MRQGGGELASSVAALARDAITRGLDALAAPAAPSPSRSAADAQLVALRWLERAHRLVPLDPNATLTLASACLAHDPARAATLFQSIVDKHDVRQAWLGLAAARLRLSGPDDAAGLLGFMLSRYAFNPDLAALVAAVGGRPGHPGWCGLRSDGCLEIHPWRLPGVRAKAGADSRAIDSVQVVLDGKSLLDATLPAGWELGQTIDIRLGNVPLLGSPIQIGAIRRLAGCVEVWDGGIRGWAWHPGDPETPPALRLLDAFQRPKRSFVARDESVVVAATGPLARPRSFQLTRADMPASPGLVHVIGPDGKDLPGSPLDPFADEAAHVTAALRIRQVYSAGPAATLQTGLDAPSCPQSPGLTSLKASSHPTVLLRPKVSQSRAMANVPALRAQGPVPVRPVGAEGRKRATTIVMPVHNGGTVVLACLDSVLASLPAWARVLVVDDGSSEDALVAALDDLVRRRKIVLLRHRQAQGFPAAANAGIRAATGRDVVLLNSDTLVPPRWLDRLREAAYASRDIGTVTPLSNDASILSYPGPARTNPRPDQAATFRLDRAAERANQGAVADIPVGVGFCLYLRRDCLNAVGSFRADLFAQGYGEENDFCLRARRLGWRNVASTGLFVGHLGGTSFGSDATHLQDRNSRIVEQLHPGYQALIDDYLARDPLAEARRRIDLHQWRERGRRWQRSVILITHSDGGGVEQRLTQAITAHEKATRRAIVLRPAETADGEPGVLVQDGAADDLPNLLFGLPRELPVLLRLLRGARPEMIEAHHLAGYPPAIYDLVTRLNVPYTVHVHDYASFCPRVSLVGAGDRYCGEPDLSDCEACVADYGHFLKEYITVSALRTRSAAFLSAARRVVVPSDDTGFRMRRHFAGLTTMTVPHEDDLAAVPAVVPDSPTVTSPTAPHATERGRASVCVVGAIGVHKGYDILLACARDAMRRDLDLEFVVVGHTSDDARMLATGRVFVTGRFEAHEAVDLIVRQNARFAFVPSICPETWCLSLSDIWRAGLQAAAFDIGAPAERIRRSGRGILLPLGLSASAINNALVTAIATAEH